MTTRQRGPRKRPSPTRTSFPNHKPFLQGDLDSLCGLYSVLNATRFLCPELGDVRSRSLFHSLGERLTALGVTSVETVSWGLETHTVQSLIGTAQDYVGEVLDVRIICEPFILARKHSRIAYVWRVLQSCLDRGCVAIIGISGKHEHWTVGIRMTEKSIQLFDSDLLTRLLRSDCSLRSTRLPHQIDPDEIFLLRRK